jgi:hypothetical protein
MAYTVDLMERFIIRQIVEHALNQGYSVAHHDGEQQTALAHPNDGRSGVYKIMDEIRATDEELLILYAGRSIAGKIWLVYGNDGYDVVADYNTSLDDLFDHGPIKDLIEAFEHEAMVGA